MRFAHVMIGLVILVVGAIILNAFINFTDLRKNLLAEKVQQVEDITEGSLGILQAGLAKGQDVGSLKEVLRDFRYDGDNYVFMIDHNHCMVLDPDDAESEGKCNTESKVRIALLAQAKQGGGTVEYVTSSGRPKVSYVRPVPGQNMYLASGVFLDDFDGLLQDLAIQQAVITAIIGLIIGGILFGIDRLLRRDIQGLAGGLHAVAGGDTGFELPPKSAVREMETMREALAIFRERMQENEKLKAESAAKSAEAEAEKHRVMQEVADNFEATVKLVVDSVSNTSTQMQETARSMTTVAGQTEQQAGSAANASEDASGNVQTVAAAAEELTASIDEIGRQVNRSSATANRAVEDARATNSKVEGLVESAQKIGDVVKLIQDIAEQTNLLALNATIEAARAGEAGKGFAVVANEVKSLATQTAKATEEISQQIGEIQGATTDAATAIKGIGGTVEEIDEIASSISAAVEEQSAATQEIARNVQQAAAGTQKAASNISEVTKTASETGLSAGQVLEAAGELSAQSEKLGEEVDRFIAQIRAA